MIPGSRVCGIDQFPTVASGARSRERCHLKIEFELQLSHNQYNNTTKPARLTPNHTMATTDAPAKPVLFKKGPRSRPNQTRRKRSATPPDEDAAAVAESSVVRPNKTSIANPLVQGTKRRRDDHSASGGLDEFEYKADEGGIRGDDFATRSSNWDIEGEGVVEADSKRVKVNEDGEITIDDGLYHGKSGYLSTIHKPKDAKEDRYSMKGPMRATANIRTITLVDYQPDVCKPYKETGFCGYGDSCKFLHDRGDYLAGWQLDQMDAEDGAAPVESEEEEMLPFACLICKKEFDEPVVTKCGHYFCMKCAVNRFIKSPKCYACGAATNGIFNKAEKLLAKLEAKQKRKREARGIKDDDEDGDGDGGIEIGGGDSDAENEDRDSD